MTRSQYWPRLILYLVVVLAFNWATIGKSSAVSFNVMLVGIMAYWPGWWGSASRISGLSAAVLACGLGAALLGYVANHSPFEVEHPIMMAVLFHLFVFGPVIVAAANVCRSWLLQQ